MLGFRFWGRQNLTPELEHEVHHGRPIPFREDEARGLFARFSDTLGHCFGVGDELRVVFASRP